MIERDYITPGRSAAIGENGMAATSHPAATLAALDVLRAGGNAVDGAIAAAAVQAVVEPAMTGIGGDCFALIWHPDSQHPVAVNGSGWSPAGLNADKIRAEGGPNIAPTSPNSVTVPGSIDAWCYLSENHGKLGIDALLRPAIAAAQDGFRITGRVARDWAHTGSRLKHHAPAANLFLPGGSPPVTGDRFRNEALAGTLSRIGRDGREAFYNGAVADEIVGVLRGLGGAHSQDDFSEFQSIITRPITAQFRTRTLVECPPNGQGLAALILARILDGFDLTDGAVSEADRIHIFAEATKAAYRQRDLFISDPVHMTTTVEELLDDRFIDQLRGGIDLRAASAFGAWDMPVHRDTVYLTVVDRDRNVVSLINSIFDSFGSGIYAPKSGVLLHNRGCGFTLEQGHPNEIGPRKRPFHTIIPAMLFSKERPVMSFGVMGGQYQAAGHGQFLSHVLDRGYDPQRANEAPRSFAHDGRLMLEPTFPDDVVRDLAARGHKLEIATDPIGGCQAIMIDHERGVLIGSSDHRKDGLALGY